MPRPLPHTLSARVVLFHGWTLEPLEPSALELASHLEPSWSALKQRYLVCPGRVATSYVIRPLTVICTVGLDHLG